MAIVQKKVTRKELLKEPDQFITFSGRLIEFGRRHQRRLTYATVAVVVLLTGFVAVRYFIARAENRAFALLDQYSADYAQAVRSVGAQSALETAKPRFEALIEQYGERTAGRMARIRFGDICYAAGQYDQAAALYGRALDEFSGEPFYRALLLSSLGYAQWQKKDLDRAAESFRQLVAIAGAPLRDQALFALADIHAAQGSKEKAIETYRRLVEEFPDSDYVRLAREQLHAG